MFVPQLPEQADAREIVFHFRIQTCKNHAVPCEARGPCGLLTRSFMMNLSLMMS